MNGCVSANSLKFNVDWIATCLDMATLKQDVRVRHFISALDMKDISKSDDTKILWTLSYRPLHWGCCFSWLWELQEIKNKHVRMRVFILSVPPMSQSVESWASPARSETTSGGSFVLRYLGSQKLLTAICQVTCYNIANKVLGVVDKDKRIWGTDCKNHEEII